VVHGATQQDLQALLLALGQHCGQGVGAAQHIHRDQTRKQGGKHRLHQKKSPFQQNTRLNQTGQANAQKKSSCTYPDITWRPILGGKVKHCLRCVSQGQLRAVLTIIKR
jgi:hypothetical protein